MIRIAWLQRHWTITKYQTHACKSIWILTADFYLFSGCLPNITKLLYSSQKKGERSIEIIFGTICASIYKQMRWREIVFRRKHQSRHADDKDLYMEQCYVCGILGYHQQFLSLDRLSAVLDWQLPPGCYGSTESPKGGHRGTEDSNVYREQWDHEDLNDDDFNDGFGY